MNNRPDSKKPLLSTAPDELRLAHEHITTLLESIGDAFVLLDGNWCLTYINGQGEQLLGARREELLGRPLLDFLPATEALRFQQRFQQARKGGEPVSFENFHPPLGKWFEVRAYPCDDGLSIHFQDITERKNHETALRDSEERYRTLVENIDLGITLIDENYRILMTNAAHGRLFGKPTSQFVHQFCFREFRKTEAPCSFCPGLAAMRTGRPATIDTEGRRDDGSRFTVRINAFPVFDADGQARKFIEVVEDITARKLAQENLRHSEMRFRSVFENSAAGMAILNPQGIFERVNRALCRFLGYPEEELLGKAIAELTHPEDLRICQKHGEEVRAGHRQMVRHEKRYRHRDGNIVWGDVTTNWILDSEKRPFYSIVHLIDTTERRLAEQALRQSEERFRTLVEQAGDAFFLHEPNGRFLDFNRQACLSLGYSREELLELTVHDIEARYKENRTIEVWETMGPGEVHTFRGMQRRKDGSEFPVEVRVSRYNAGDRDLIIALARDITQSTLAEEALKGALVEARDARDKVDAILKSIADGLLVTDRHHRLTVMNRAAEELLGISFADAINWPITAVIRDPAFDHRVGASSSWEVAEGGTQRVIRARNFDMRAQSLGAAGRITILQDVTREHEIARLKNEFLSTAAHELRTPLASVMGFTELLQQRTDLTPAQQQEFLSIIYANSEDLEVLIDDLLNLNRIEAGRPVCLNPSHFDLRDEIARLVGQFRSEFPQHAFVVELSQPLVVWWDQAKIAQVLENLLGNAVKFSPGGGPVHLEAQPEGDQVRVTVRDLGIGMSGEQSDHAFDTFYRGDASDTAVRGLGIGLSVARGIIEAHGGRISLESAPGQGTRISFLTPRGLAPASA